MKFPYAHAHAPLNKSPTRVIQKARLEEETEGKFHKGLFTRR